MDYLMGYLETSVLTDRRAGVGVAVKAREIAAGNLHSKSVASLDDMAGCPKVDRVFVDPAPG